MGKRNKVTTRDIAEYTGVSQSSVSMILSNKQNVSFSDETSWCFLPQKSWDIKSR